MKLLVSHTESRRVAGVTHRASSYTTIAHPRPFRKGQLNFPHIKVVNLGEFVNLSKES